METKSRKSEETQEWTFEDFRIRKSKSPQGDYCRLEIWHFDGILWEPCLRTSLQCGGDAKTFKEKLEKMRNRKTESMEMDVTVTRGGAVKGDPDDIWPPKWVEMMKFKINKSPGGYSVSLGYCKGFKLTVDDFVDLSGNLIQWLGNC